MGEKKEYKSTWSEEAGKEGRALMEEFREIIAPFQKKLTAYNEKYKVELRRGTAANLLLFTEAGPAKSTAITGCVGSIDKLILSLAKESDSVNEIIEDVSKEVLKERLVMGMLASMLDDA